MSRFYTSLIAAAFAAALSISTASAQAPRQIRFIVPFPAGGGADLLTRVLSEQWGQTHGVSTVIENRPGAASVIGTEAASRVTMPRYPCVAPTRGSRCKRFSRAATRHRWK